MSAELDTFRLTITGPWTPEVWERDLEGLTGHVKRCFEAATTRFAPPSQDGCRYFSNYLLNYFLSPKNFSSSKKDEPEPLGSRQKTIKYGKTFLKHLSGEREWLQEWHRFLTVFNHDEDRKRVEITLFHIAETERHLECLFERLSSKRPPKNDGIRFLANLAQDLWEETNDGRAPRSKTADGPICRFLIPVLKAINLNPSPATIADALRGKR